MTLNPISYTDRVITDFLRYQITAYPFADERLHAQMRRLLSLDESRRTPLFKGPYVSLSRAFRSGGKVAALAAEGVLHPFMPNLVPFEELWGHQERAIRAITAGRSTLISTGTGSGKTECFLYPAISHCLRLRDEAAPPGIVAIFVYPMNALAEDQLGRVRGLLAGTGIPFGMYVGKTPERAADVPGQRLRAGASLADYRTSLARARAEKRGTAVHPAEERPSREEMRAARGQPRILFTNVKQLELLLTRQYDVELFAGADLRFIVFDEAHTYGGAAGAETACLIRRLRSYCDRAATETVCVGTSATLVDPEGEGEAARDFGARFFGVPAGAVELVREEYQADDWVTTRASPPAPPSDLHSHLEEILAAIDSGADAPSRLPAAYARLTGGSLMPESWPDDLYTALAGNEFCFQLARELAHPLPLEELAKNLSGTLGRKVTESEILAWLALGAASRRGGRPLLRPVVHGFTTGVGAAVVTLPRDHDGPRLWLSGDVDGGGGDREPLCRLEITTCRTCGQHYFVHYVADLSFGPAGLAGGEAVGDRRVWRSLGRDQGGVRVVLLDQLVAAEDDDEDPARTQEVLLCRHCGALHPDAVPSCDACGRPGPLVRLLAVEHRDKHPGFLTSCLSCKAPGGGYGARYREPARPVRAVSVSDVHVLAQNMIHRADRKRLLVFADNRQEAAFQAGWMRDHARRFRIRSLMNERIRQGAVSVGDLAAHLDRLLERDDALSRALIPEVWNVARKETAGVVHAEERRAFLRILVLREITTGVKQRIGLEPWGRLRIEYVGLTSEPRFIQEWARRLEVAPERLADGIAAIVDSHRRNVILYDAEGKIFSRFWQEGDREIQRGYLPLLRGVPKGVKLRRERADAPGRLVQWLSERGQTAVRQAAVALGVEKDQLEEFLEGLWRLLTEELGLLTPVTLTGARGRALPGCAGARQVDADKILITPHRGRWRCRKCRRAQVRPTPRDACIAWRCDGTLVFEVDDPDNYDLIALEQEFEMLRPAEHSAQVPAGERERLEELFKGESDALNTLVCTPTLELGVDIGGLDTVLLRNVPPLPANYWQRVGRAGRRHRLAVNLTYARPTTHDQAYFAEPLKLLNGRVEPPRFNLKNDVMLGKHVRAAVITRLQQLARSEGELGEYDRNEVAAALDRVFPEYIRDYLFDAEGRVRTDLFDLSPLETVVTKHQAVLVSYVERTFAQDWPAADVEAVEPARLQAAVLATPGRLQEVVRTLKRRLDWALGQIERLNTERRSRGTLEPDEDQLYQRCDALVKRLKGVARRHRRETEGYDETNTYGVLAAEGFLPGYGLEIGAVIGTAIMPRHLDTGSDFTLPRPPALALREYVPGNLIYANGHRFVARYFHRFVGEEREEPVRLTVDVEHGAVREIGVGGTGEIAPLGAPSLLAIPVCDVDLTHVSRIMDDEDYRFQMAVATEGYELSRHGDGLRYDWGGRDLTYRHAVHLRLVNLGAAALVREGTLGYPMSLVSGQSRSPFASQAELDNFAETQRQRTGQPIDWVGLYADVVADALTVPDCATREEAHSLLEAMRTGMNQVLDMERDDLETLVIGRSGSDEVDALLYDPMPGGSGLLEQACERWGEVVARARELLDRCQSACERSCIDCLQTFRNAYVHRYLNRHVAVERLNVWGLTLRLAHAIPARLPAAAPRGEAMPVNDAEQHLRLLLERGGLPAGEWQHPIDLGRPLGTTRPDVFFAGDEPADPGVCVYLDGLSNHIHGRAETAAKDRQIREELRARHYEVFEIAATHLHDRDQMSSHFYRLARVLMGKDRARQLRDDASWFKAPEQRPE